MSLRKMATQETPHATYTSRDGWIYKVLKVNAPKKNPMKFGSAWMCAVQSPYTHGGWDYGDTYAQDVLMNADPESMSLEFTDYMQEHGL